MVKYFLAVGALLLLSISDSAAAQNDVMWTGGISTEKREQAPQDGTRLEFFVTTVNYLSLLQSQSLTVRVHKLSKQPLPGPG